MATVIAIARALPRNSWNEYAGEDASPQLGALLGRLATWLALRLTIGLAAAGMVVALSYLTMYLLLTAYSNIAPYS